MTRFAICVPICHRCKRLDVGACSADPGRRQVSDLATAGTCPLNLFAAVLMGAPAAIAAGYDPEAERENLRKGGCCDPPSLLE